jgi:hypothetical protein
MDFIADRGKVYARPQDLRQPWTPEERVIGLNVCRKVDEFVRLAPYFGERRMLTVWGDPLAKAWVVLEPLVRDERDETAWQTKWDVFERLGTKALSARFHLQAIQQEANQAPNSDVQPTPACGRGWCPMLGVQKTGEVVMKLSITNVKIPSSGHKGVLFLLTQGVLSALGCLTPHQAIAALIYFSLGKAK